MLSKLFFGLHPIKTTKINGFYKTLQKSLEEKYSFCRRLDDQESPQGGTLGILSIWEIDGKKVIAKTHLPGKMYRHNIDKEYMILQKLYGEEIFSDKVELIIDGRKMSILLMEKLKPVERKILPQDVLNLISVIQNNTTMWHERELGYRTKDLIVFAQKALKELSEVGLICDKLSDELHGMESDLHKILRGSLVLSHGDLSNLNILCKGEKLYLLDWEDSFLCTADYDFVYWLTFLAQEEYLTKSWFQKFGICNRRSEVLMLTIVLLKSYIAFVTGTYKNYKIPINERLRRIYCIFE